MPSGIAGVQELDVTGHHPVREKGAVMPVGALRYGRTISDQYGENIEWRHWGCVTPDILRNLANENLNQVTGFSELSPGDQAKIRLAIKTRCINPADIPESAKSGNEPTVTTQKFQQKKGMQGSSRSSNSTQPAESSRSRNVSTVATTKRKAVDELTHFLNSTQLPAASQQVEVIEDDSEDETIEELYCTLPTSVVGVRYYEGLVGSGEEVVLKREPHNEFDG
ncbi:hypothetical protein Ac2012v2_005048 [Leucoagaricus gongylophorus]